MQKDKLLEILDAVRFYPSPHNSQPIRLKIVGDNIISVYYDLQRGLPAESFGAQFGYVCAGVFLESLAVVAAHHGFKTVESLELKEMDFTSAERFHLLGNVSFEPMAEPIPEADVMYDSYLKRQTSRIPYDNQMVDQAALDEASALSRERGFELKVSHDEKQVKEIIAINQRTLFYDLENDAVYNELMTWLRFSEQEARSKADGLSARTMLINGSLLHFILKHRGMWKLPVIGNIVRTVYLNTMRGVRQVAWIEGPFQTMKDYVAAGKCFMRVWLILTEHGIYIHPYGTVITNPRSHQEFVELANVQEHGGRMAWMLFRLGYSKVPPKSYRRDIQEMLIED